MQKQVRLSQSQDTFLMSMICVNEILRLMAMKMMLKVKNRSGRYNIYRPRPRQRNKYTKYKMCLSMMVFISG